MTENKPWQERFEESMRDGQDPLVWQNGNVNWDGIKFFISEVEWEAKKGRDHYWTKHLAFMLGEVRKSERAKCIEILQGMKRDFKPGCPCNNCETARYFNGVLVDTISKLQTPETNNDPRT